MGSLAAWDGEPSSLGGMERVGEARSCFRLSSGQPSTFPICLTLYYYSGHERRGQGNSQPLQPKMPVGHFRYKDVCFSPECLPSASIGTKIAMASQPETHVPPLSLAQPMPPLPSGGGGFPNLSESNMWATLYVRNHLTVHIDFGTALSSWESQPVPPQPQVTKRGPPAMAPRWHSDEGASVGRRLSGS